MANFMALVSAGLLAAPLAADAQQAKKVWRIGYLSPTVPNSNELTWLRAFLDRPKPQVSP
jgi:hypothetical protein